MAESEEHRFLSNATLDVLDRMSGCQLYGYREANRKEFDFACDLVRDWNRVVSGQTLWKHPEGVDQDIRSLLTDDDAEVCIYVARHTVKSRNIFQEAMRGFRRSVDRASTWRLRAIWIPEDFEAGNEDAEGVVVNILEEALLEDVLLNTVLGGITAENVRLFASSSGYIGVDLAVLYQVGFSGFFNQTALAKTVGVSTAKVNQALLRLTGCGFLEQPDPGGGYYYMSNRGRVFFEICERLAAAGDSPGPELAKILALLELDTAATEPSSGLFASRFDAVNARVVASVQEFGVDLSRTDYFKFWEDDLWPPNVLRPKDFRAASMRRAS